MNTRFDLLPPVQGCYEHCCSGFYRLERLPQNLAGPSLTNAIHPVFAIDRFSFDMNYTALEPSLRLATHLLEATLPFFSHIIHANRVLISIDSNGKASYELQGNLAHPTAGEIRTTRNTLMHFGSFMRYAVYPSAPPGESDNLPSSTEFGPFMQNGIARFMITTLARRYYQQAVDIHNGSMVDVVEVHWNLFNIAVTFVHELVHAFTMTIMHEEHYPPAVMPDVYFPGSLCSEEGYEWEFQTFGGLVSPRNPRFQEELADHYIGGEGKHFYSFLSNDGRTELLSEMARMISMENWPNLALFKSYQAAGDPMGRRGTLPEVHIRWNVEFENIHRLFQNSFWMQPIVPGLLRFPRRTGQRFFGNEQENCEGQEMPFGTVDDGDGDVDVTTGIHSGCRVQYHPSSGGTGLVIAPGCVHSFLWRRA